MLGVTINGYQPVYSRTNPKPLARPVVTTAPMGDALVRFGASKVPIEQIRRNLVDWADRIIQRDSWYFVPEIRPPRLSEALRSPVIQDTLSLYQDRFNTFFWTGIECSNPKVDGDRWDQLELTGFFNPSERKQQLKQMREIGVENVRLGLPLHRMVKTPKQTGFAWLDKGINQSAQVLAGKGLLPIQWKPFDEIYRDVREANPNNKISLDIMHFGLPDIFEEPGRPEKSHFLNPRWPSFFAKLAVETVKRYPDLEAVTLVNEPFVTNNFCSGMWNEKVGGDKAFIDRAIHIARGAVMARAGIESLLRKQNRRLVFLHNESCEYRSNDPDFNRFKRFLTSDLILGADWLLKEPLDKSNPTVKWMLDHGAGESPKGKADLLKTLHWFKQQHQQFEQTYNKPMKADTVFGVDYYVTCESGPSITHNVGDYPLQARHYQSTRTQPQPVGRKGLYEMVSDYWERYRLPILHAETNMKPQWQEKWATQQLVELAMLEKSGIPVLGFNWYSLLDQFGWENGLRGPVPKTRDEAIQLGRLNPLGFLSHPPQPDGSYLSHPITQVIQAVKQQIQKQ